ncbi:MAG TPA: S8 family serine peptidase [Blastocatellia bacterium]|nr:S8 family serine peptidase [Blastocatellia bacterium]
MNRGLLVSLIAVMLFALTAIVAADFSTADDNIRPTAKTLAASRSAMRTDARAYRSPGRLRKVIIDANDADALARAAASGATIVADYGSFKLFVMDNDALNIAEIERRADTATEQGAPRPFTVRDDFNLLLLRAGAIDTTEASAPGRFVGLGGASAMSAQSATPRAPASDDASPLRLIQFVGPVKSEWLRALRASGLEPIAYVPNNAYLVRGSATATASLMRAAAHEQFVQWEGPFADDYKIHPRLKEMMREQADAVVNIAVQIATDANAQDAATAADVKAARRLASAVRLDAHPVLNFINMRLTVSASKITELAALAGVVNIEPWSEPQLFDERAAQVVAGQLASDFKAPTGPGYMNWLQAHGFTSRFNFVIDVTDTGLDRGATTPDKLHAAFLDASGQSRVAYARDYTSDLDPGDVAGHGTINMSIAAGMATADPDARDSGGYNYGLGIAPFAMIGSSRIFKSSGRFDLIDPFTKLISEAYRDGARISSNSWGDNDNSYSIDAQEYDSRTRDAVPAQPGNQDMLLCFAAGNSGGTSRVGAPSTAKNVISVGASQSTRQGGKDGCGVFDEDSQDAMSIAFFSSGGPSYDGRIKPDLVAPGTHVEGAASQHPDFIGSSVCGEAFGKPYFPLNQTLYTWSSGTSHSTPQVAGGAALARQFFLSRGEEPSAALIKALLLATTSYMTGTDAKGDLPHVKQGWGLMNLNRAFDSVPKFFVNQTTVFNDSGQEMVLTGEVKDATQPFRVTLCWTDAPGFSGAAPWVNDLDLEVTINGQVYRGNNFRGQESQPGGISDTKNNVEAVWLPAGTVGTFVVRVRAANVAGDGVPGNSDASDQDFALVVYNGERRDAPVAAVANVTLSGGADAYADPGESVTMQVNLSDLAPVALAGGHGVLTAKTTGVSVTNGQADFPNIAPGQTVTSLTPFAFTVDRGVACGTAMQFTLDVTSNGLLSRVPLTITAGRATPVELFSDDIESGEGKWTHASFIKKKKKKVPLDTWSLTARRVHAGGQAWFSSDPGQASDTYLATQPIALPADGRNLQLVFYHMFEFESGMFDGGVLEISTGGDFEDLGAKIIKGGYTGTIWEGASSTLAGRDAWVNGRLGTYQQVIVDLSSYAGKTVTIRFHFASDTDIGALGWYIDDVSLRGDRVSCTPAN